MPQSQTEITPITYNDLQRSVDELVGKFGLEQTIGIIKRFSGNTQLGKKQSFKLRLVKDFMVGRCIEVFDLKESEFYHSEITEYRNARMACLHLLHKFTGCSHARLGEYFDRKRHQVIYYLHKCNEILEIPQFHKDFVGLYRELESSAVHFISSIEPVKK